MSCRGKFCEKDTGPIVLGAATTLAIGAVLVLWPKAEKAGIQMRASGVAITF